MGLKAFSRGISKLQISHFGATVVGILDGFEGLVEGRTRELASKDVSGIKESIFKLQAVLLDSQLVRAKGRRHFLW